MTEYFEYNTNRVGVDPRMFKEAPIWPDFDSTSEYSKKLLQAKNYVNDDFWNIMRDVIAHDLETLPIQRFKLWMSVWTVPFITTIKFATYIKIALDLALTDTRFHHALMENGVGMTKEDFAHHLTMFVDYPTTMNRIQALSHLAICDYRPETLEKMDTIVELGAGVGDMADIIYRLGFKGKYIIYDFPEVGAIQKYYHDTLGYKNIVHTSNINDLVNADLVIGTWSFTEMPLALRRDIMPMIRGSKNWLLAYSNEIFGIDNKEYMHNEFIPEVVGKQIKSIEIPFMPWHGGSYYFTVKDMESEDGR